MACIQTLSGIAASCETNIGGIIEVYIANYGDIASTAVTSNQITTITMSSTAKFKPYYFKKNTGSLTSTLNVDPTNGVNFVQSDLVLQFAKQDTTKRIEIAALSLGELAIIVKDANAKYWYLGETEFVAATAGAAESGTNRADGNKYSITLTDYNPSYPKEILVGTGGVDLSAIVAF